MIYIHIKYQKERKNFLFDLNKFRLNNILAHYACKLLYTYITIDIINNKLQI